MLTSLLQLMFGLYLYDCIVVASSTACAETTAARVPLVCVGLTRVAPTTASSAHQHCSVNSVCLDTQDGQGQMFAGKSAAACSAALALFAIAMTIKIHARIRTY